MTESQNTTRWISEMRKKHPEWTIIKFNDRITKGIPDLAISNGKKTLWVECKKFDTPRPPLQRFFLKKLGGVYLVFGAERCWIEKLDDTVAYLGVEAWINAYLY